MNQAAVSPSDPSPQSDFVTLCGTKQLVSVILIALFLEAPVPSILDNFFLFFLDLFFFLSHETQSAG